MHQTLLALGALVLTMFFALSTQESAIHVEQAKTRSEIETLAGQAALNVLAHVAAQPFDAATVAGPVASAAELTPAAAFPTGRAYAAAADVDDFHRMATYTYVTADSLLFDVDAEVAYVDETTAPSATPTFQKEVTVTVGHQLLRQPLSVSRVVTWP